MTEDTIFRIYSMTKPITSAAIMMLVEEGAVALDDPVGKHLAELGDLRVVSGKGETAPAGRQPTVEDLLRHTGGFSYGFLGGEVAHRYRKADVLARDSSIDAMLEKLRGIPLQLQPGEKWRYSISIDLLGAIVERASGQKFDAFLEKRIFAPLGMGDTGFHVPADKADRFTSQHGKTLLGKLKVSEAAATSHYLKPAGLPSGGGGLCSTVDDYLRFCQMVLNGGEFEGRRLLKPESVALMTSNQLPPEIPHIGIGDARTGVGFGYGFSVRKADGGWGFGGRKGEIGWGGAASTHFWMLPSEGLVVITMRNYMPYQWTLEKDLKKLVYGALR